MKEAKANEIQKCALCDLGVMNSHVPVFYTVKVDRMCIDMQAVKEQQALSVLVGNEEIASVMGPNRSIAKRIADGKEVWVCQNCALSLDLCVGEMSERFGDTDDN